MLSSVSLSDFLPVGVNRFSQRLNRLLLFFKRWLCAGESELYFPGNRISYYRYGYSFMKKKIIAILEAYSASPNMTSLCK